MRMESVNKRWYIGYSWWMAINAIAIIAIWIASFFVPEVKAHITSWGIAPTTVALACLTLIYRLTLYKKNARDFGLNFATFIMSCFQFANAINILNLTGWSGSPYLIIVLLMCFFGGFVGIYPIIGASLILSLFVLIAIPNFDSYGPALRSVSEIISIYLVCIISYFVWRRQYITEEDLQLSKLSSLLKSKQQESEILIRSIVDGIIVFDINGRINLMNPSASTMTQWPITETINIDIRLVMKLLSEDGKSLELKEDIFTEVLTKKINFNQTVSLVGREGLKQIISLIISPVTNPANDQIIGAVAVMRDISATKKIEQQRADFISTASHEMRTPVAAIEGYLALAMNNNVSKIDSKAREYLEKAHASTQHLGKLFQDLLTSAKAEDGRLSSHPVVTEIGAFTESLADDLKIVAQKKMLDMEYVISNHENQPSENIIDTIGSTNKIISPLYFSRVDPDRIREVITNLFDNAVKYTEKGKITLSVTGDKSVVQIRVADTGPGIPAEDLPHLFQKFYRVDNTATRALGGTGLGLFICKMIIEFYNGTIWAESKLGEGSIFYINLPRLSSDQALILKQKETANFNS